MPEYLAPGVYVEEIEIGAKPIEGVSTSTAGFLGETERGPTVPRLVTSWLDYQRAFGSYFGADQYLPYTVEGFFANGGKRCYVGRIVKAGDEPATIASLKLKADGGNALTMNAVGEGVWGNRVAVKVSPGSLEGFKLSLFYWKEMPRLLYDPEIDTKTLPRPAVIEVFDNLSVIESSPDYYGKRVNGISNLVELSVESGDSGEVPEVGCIGTAQGVPEELNTIKLGQDSSATDDAYNGMKVEITSGNGAGQTRNIMDYNGATRVAIVDADWNPVPDETSQYRVYTEEHSGTASIYQGSSLDRIKLSSEASTEDDAYNGMTIEITEGEGAGQTRKITDYTGSTQTAQVDSNWNPVPNDTSKYRIGFTEHHSGTAQAAEAPQKIILSSDASGEDDVYNGMQIEITAGSGEGQTRIITDYAGATRVASVDSTWDTNPDNTSEYHIKPAIECLMNGTDSSVHEGTAQAGSADTIILSTGASTDDDAYNGMQIEITGGPGAGQIRTIDDYVGSTRTATVDANWDTNPTIQSNYRINNPNPDLVLSDFKRTDTDIPGKRKGLTGFKQVDDISIVYSPNPKVINGLVGALISHCENLKDRFTIIDAERSSANVSNLKPRDSHETKYAAFYYPWIQIIDPESGVQRLVPPGGHVAGIYARSDTERGVHKAPANEKVRGITGLEFQINKGEQDVLNPRGVNCIRAFSGRGIRVWGARTLSSNSLWKYINVRRLFLYLEESIEKGTQWVVFEPNDEKLWARVIQTIKQFLTGVWKSGALMGSTPEEAFFIKCDRTTMTQDDIDNGRLICLIGVAPVKPAEFVIFRIAQWQGGSAATE